MSSPTKPLQHLQITKPGWGGDSLCLLPDSFDIDVNIVRPTPETDTSQFFIY